MEGYIPELIETLWNVNESAPADWVEQLQELIETLWNVNCVFLFRIQCCISELIETLWNVNKPHFKAFATSTAN